MSFGGGATAAPCSQSFGCGKWWWNSSGLAWLKWPAASDGCGGGGPVKFELTPYGDVDDMHVSEVVPL